MIREDVYKGELVPTSSPNLNQNVSADFEAAQNASFGKYDYDPGMRLMSQPVQLYPGCYGYNTAPNPAFMNPPMGVGIGMGTWQQQYNYGYNTYGYQPNYTQYQQPQTIQYHIPGVNFSSEFLPPIGYEEEIEKLQIEYWQKQQEIEAKQIVDRKNSGYYSGYGYNGYNYYGVPYYNPYQYNSLNSEYSQKLKEMQDQARESRLQFNINLARLAHNFAGDTYDDNLLQERYTGKTVEGQNLPFNIPQMYIENRFASMVPFDNAQMYREMDAAVSREFNSVISADSNMQQCFENMGVLATKYELQEEQHRRRNGAILYNSDDNSYKYFVRAKAAERYSMKNGTPIYGGFNNTPMPAQNLMNSFPTLSQSASLTDDGVLKITCNFGSKAGQTYSVHNSQEAGYDEDRARFQSFLNAIPDSIYLKNPNQNGGGQND